MLYSVEGKWSLNSKRFTSLVEAALALLLNVITFISIQFYLNKIPLNTPQTIFTVYSQPAEVLSFNPHNVQQIIDWNK